jgi:hypothetical protein
MKPLIFTIKRVRKLAAILVAGGALIGALPMSAQAATHECSFKLATVNVNNGGGLFLEGNVGTTWIGAQYVCNIDSAYNSVSTEVCKNWVAISLTAQASGKPLYLIFDDGGDSTKTDCSTWAAWTTPKILYFGIKT